MSMKLVNWLGRFPMEDEHENGNNGVGVARPGADTDAECREPEPGSDPRVFVVERADRVQQWRAGGTIPVGGAGIGGAEVPKFGKRRAGLGTGLPAESDRIERGADHAVDPGVSRLRRNTAPVVPTARVRSEVHGGRHCVVSGRGSGTQAVERTRHAPDLAARLRTVRREAVRATVEDQRGALVQPAGERALSPPGGGVRTDAVHCGRHRTAAQSPIRKGGRGMCAWIRCIKGTAREPRACITSTPWMR